MPNGPNMNNNHMTPHANPSMGMMEGFEGRNLMISVDKMKTPIATVKEKLLMNEVFPGYDAKCEHCVVNPHTCQVLKVGVQKLIDQGVVLVEQSSTTKEVTTLEIPYD